MWKRFVVFLIILPIIGLCFLPSLLWKSQDSTPLQVAVIDKTVPKNDYREHAGLFWMLEHLNISKSEKEYYQISKDFYGYHPDHYQGDTILKLPAKPDVMYVADTYGVYEKDVEGNPLGIRSDLIYGGVTLFEWNKVMAAKTPDNTLIVEFNSLASPTSPETRKIMENNLGITWTGWIGRYFPKLQNTEVPVWMKENWEKQYNEKWKYEGPGIAFVNEEDQILILPQSYFSGDVEYRWTESGKRAFLEQTDHAPYHYWFDVIIPHADTTVEGNYEIDWNAEAMKILKDHNIPLTFPAVLHKKKEKIYYFAGDYADVGTTYYSRWKLWDGYYRVNSFFNHTDAFFWDVYVPLMKQILNEERRG